MLRNLTKLVQFSKPSSTAFKYQVPARFLSTQVKDKIETAINSHKVCLFMKGTPDFPQCGFSRAAVSILNMQGVENFSSVNILEDDEVRTGIKEFSNWPTIPQLYVAGDFVGGCDIMIQMHQDGMLEKLLLEKKVVEPVEGSETVKE